MAEDRLLFKNAMERIGLKCAQSGCANRLAPTPIPAVSSATEAHLLAHVPQQAQTSSRHSPAAPAPFATCGAWKPPLPRRRSAFARGRLRSPCPALRPALPALRAAAAAPQRLLRAFILHRAGAHCRAKVALGLGATKCN